MIKIKSTLKITKVIPLEKISLAIPSSVISCSSDNSWLDRRAPCFARSIKPYLSGCNLIFFLLPHYSNQRWIFHRILRSNLNKKSMKKTTPIIKGLPYRCRISLVSHHDFVWILKRAVFFVNSDKSPMTYRSIIMRLSHIFFISAITWHAVQQ